MASHGEESEPDALRLDEERFRTILEHAPVMIDSFDEDGTCLIWNRECVRRLGWTREELANLPNPIAVFYPDPKVLGAVSRHIRAADGQFREYEVRAKDGSARIQRWANFRTPRSRSIISVGYDVTEQRMMEAQLRQAQKLDAVGRLTGSIAHDFNNLLTVVLAGADLLLGEVEPGTVAEDLTRQIRQAAADGAELVRQLGTFSRNAPLSPTAVDLHALLDEIGPSLRRLLPESIDLRVEHARGPLYVLADVVALKQIIMNLVTNARDAIEARGSIEIATRMVPERPRERVLMSVRDSGRGMTPEVRERAFEPFFTTKAPGKGTGLGLPTVYGLVAQHAGTVELSSTPGQGTCVDVSLPVLEGVPDDQNEAKPEGSASTSGSETILLVEDDVGARAIAKTALEHLGYGVVVAENGRRALEVLEQHPEPFALILSDVVMPELTGPELLARLQASGRPFPAFAFCSGHSSDEATRALDPSIRLLTKPWSLSTLGAFVRSCIGDQATRAGRRSG